LPDCPGSPASGTGSRAGCWHRSDDGTTIAPSSCIWSASPRQQGGLRRGHLFDALERGWPGHRTGRRAPLDYDDRFIGGGAPDACPTREQWKILREVAGAAAPRRRRWKRIHSAVPRARDRGVAGGGAPMCGHSLRRGVDSTCWRIHQRLAANLIVYHHTAMNSASRFEDVVRVIKNRVDEGKHWVTGYHCVVTSDGVAHPFCRWDRYGNHVAGYNRRSLGISFNGNFETNPSVPYANPDGRYGAPRPTEEQLRTGARVVALWSLVYVDLDFTRVRAPRSRRNRLGSMLPVSSGW
jgi:hypothetical protein